MSKTKYFDREGNEVTIEDWMRARQSAEVSVNNTIIPHGPGSIEVSTIWLGIQDKDGIVHYETMVYGGRLDDQTWNSNTEEEARVTHEHVVKLVRKNK